MRAAVDEPLFINTLLGLCYKGNIRALELALAYLEGKPEVKVSLGVTPAEIPDDQLEAEVRALLSAGVFEKDTVASNSISGDTP